MNYVYLKKWTLLSPWKSSIINDIQKSLFLNNFSLSTVQLIFSLPIPTLVEFISVSTLLYYTVYLYCKQYFLSHGASMC